MLAALALAACVGPGVRRHGVEAVRLVRPCEHTARSLPLLVYRPPGYDDPGRSTERWPLVLHLHGILAEGTNPSSVTRDGLPKLLEQGFSPPCLVVSPQLWTFAQTWEADVVLRVLEHVEQSYRVDPDRIVLMGISAGATTGWKVVRACPDRFAGFVSVAGWSTAGGVERMRDVDVWAVFGGLDFTAPAFLAARGVRAHHAVGGKTRVSVLRGVSHWIPRRVWQWPEMWDWILSRRRGAEGPCPEYDPGSKAGG